MKRDREERQSSNHLEQPRTKKQRREGNSWIPEWITNFPTRIKYARYSTNQAAFFAALIANDVNELRYFSNAVDINAENVINTTPLILSTPLHYAADKGYNESVQLLVNELGANVNVQNHNGYTPLHYAACEDHNETVQLLVKELKANVNVKDKQGNTPLHEAVCKNCTQTVRVLIEKLDADVNVKDNNGSTPLHYGAKLGDTEVVWLLVNELEADVNAQNNYGSTPLHEAAYKGHTETVNRLVEKLGANVNAQDMFGKTPLHDAAEHGHMKTVRVLIESGADIDAADYNDCIPLENAVRCVHIATVKYLLTLPAVTENPRCSAILAVNNNRLFRQAAENGDVELVNQLLEYPEVIDNITVFDNVALRAARRNRHQAVVDRLLEIDAVRHYDLIINPPPEEENLRRIAQNRENAMGDLTSLEQGVLAVVKAHYNEKYLESDQADIYDSLKTYLEMQYKASPAIHEGKALPLEYDKECSEAAQAQYYTNPFHTAWRYLFAKPNLWMSPDANFVSRDEQDRGAAVLTEQDSEDLAYLWLAASDENFMPMEGYTHDSIKELFVLAVAFMGRTHNWDKTREIIKKDAQGNDIKKTEEYDDGEGDKPTCSMGVSKRLVQSVLGNPITTTPNARDISADIVKNLLNEHLIAAHGDYSDNIYATVSKLNIEALQLLKNALAKKALMTDNLNDNEEAVLKQLDLSNTALDKFIGFAKNWFGEKRITRANASKITYQRENFNSYEALIQHLSKDIGAHFFNEVNSIISGLIGKPEKQGSLQHENDFMFDEASSAFLPQQSSVLERQSSTSASEAPFESLSSRHHNRSVY